MTLSNLFKAQAIFCMAICCCMFWVAPEFASQGPGWTLTPRHGSISFGQIVAVPLIALGVFGMDGAKLGWRKP